jgi:hypothetical protein
MMLSHFSPFPKIVVSGPQRSGTRLVAKAIAHDLGHIYVDEREIHTDSLYSLMAILAREGQHVIQAPGLMRWLHLFAGWKGLAVVVVHRPVAEILDSRRRMHWGWEPLERAIYSDVIELMELGNKPLPEIKYLYWEAQKRAIPNAFDVNYHDLEHHPLWVEDRAGWSHDQTTK